MGGVEHPALAMYQEIQVGDKIAKVYPGSFVKLQDVETNAATPSSVAYENIKKNIKHNLPKIETLPEYRKIKGHGVPIALVGGGPSLNKHLEELREFKTIIVCGSPHDYLISKNIIPTYAAICDPDALSINYYQNPHTEVKYLISTGVDEKVISHLKDYQVVLWHCHSNDYDRVELEKLEGKDYHGISGGCTVGLRSINIAIMLGYTNLHLFGFDSCLSNEECHVYAVSKEERESFGRLYQIKLRDLVKGDGQGPGDKVYTCLGYQLAQANNFKEFYLNFGRIFTPTFHGEGLLPDLYKLIINVLGEEAPKCS